MFDEVFQPIAAELHQVRELFRKTEAPGVPEFQEIFSAVNERPGKWMRPGLFLLAAGAVGQISPGHLDVATAIEMIHTASLLHDDVLDGATQRRHQPTVNARWGNRRAIIFGDFLLASAFRRVADSGIPGATLAFARIIETLCHGEALQESLSARPMEISEQDATSVATHKTALFLAEICRLGASRPDDCRTSERLYNYGLYMGLSYQIVDDVLDILGNERDEGKTLRTDILLSRPTLAMALLLKRSRPEAEKLFPPSTAADVDAAALLMLRSGAISESLRRAENHLKEARLAITYPSGAPMLNGMAGSFGALLEALRAKCQSLPSHGKLCLGPNQPAWG